jgi:hypothetical protein
MLHTFQLPALYLLFPIYPEKVDDMFKYKLGCRGLEAATSMRFDVALIRVLIGCVFEKIENLSYL